jgi:uracil-DNA glycosylase
MDEDRSARLAALNATLDSCSHCATHAMGLRHIPGGGKDDRPELLLVFINPTFRNMTAAQDWPGPRFPFAGKPRLWGILAEAGLVDAALPGRIAALGPTPAMVELLIAETRRAGLYLTNALKCVDSGARLPAAERVRAARPFLEQEIALVQPRRIVTFGLIPFQALTERALRLADHLWDAEHGRISFYPSRPIAGAGYPVFPCYFPTGRGNPVAATRLLRALRAFLDAET